MSATSLKPVSQPFTSTTWAFVARILKPVVRIILRMGFSAEQICQMVRKLAVDAAMEYPEFRAPQRKRAFIAHAAVATGLSRKEVAKLNDMEDLEEATDTPQVNRSVRVLAGWLNDPRYRDSATDQPLAILPFKASKGVSFHQLVKEYGGDVPPRSVLDALLQKGVLTREGNNIELVQRHPQRFSERDEEMNFIGIMLGDALSTAEFDLRPDNSERRLYREWYQLYVPVEQVAQAQTIIREETLAFGETLDRRLAEIAHRSAKANTRYRRVGLGAYYFESESPKST